MKQVKKLQFTVKLNGTYRTSPEYDTEEERLADVAKFLKHYPIRLSINFFSTTHYVADDSVDNK